MTKRDYFNLGNKWVALYVLALAIWELFNVFPLTFAYMPQLRQSVPTFTVSHWLSFIAPIGFLMIGIHLIRGRSYLCDFVFRGESEDSIVNQRQFFDVTVKLYGLYLVAVNIPGCVRLIAVALIVLRAPPYMSVEDELAGLQSSLPHVLTAIGLGMCCLVGSNKLTDLAFRRRGSMVP